MGSHKSSRLDVIGQKNSTYVHLDLHSHCGIVGNCVFCFISYLYFNFIKVYHFNNYILSINITLSYFPYIPIWFCWFINFFLSCFIGFIHFFFSTYECVSFQHPYYLLSNSVLFHFTYELQLILFHLIHPFPFLYFHCGYSFNTHIIYFHIFFSFILFINFTYTISSGSSTSLSTLSLAYIVSTPTLSTFVSD